MNALIQPCPPEKTTLDAWTARGKELFGHLDGMAWEIGDWAAFGQIAVNRDGVLTSAANGIPPSGILRKFCEANNISYQSAKNYAWVARSIPPTMRIDSLTFSHHQLVASLSPAEQRKWLRRADTDHWSVAELTRQLRASRCLTGSDGPVMPFAERPILALVHELSRHAPDKMSPEERDYYRQQLKPVIEFYQMLG
jgi:hypothetical protein